MARDPWNDPQTQRWVSHVKHQVLPMIKDANVADEVVEVDLATPAGREVIKDVMGRWLK